MDIVLDDGDIDDEVWEDSMGKVALARLRTRDSAPPMPRSRWMKTT
jgi:hypothetical protein